MPCRAAVRKWLICVPMIAASLFLCGCPDSTSKGTPNTVTLPFKGQEVELCVPKSLNLPNVWEVLIQEWSSQTGATVRWAEYSDDDAAELAKRLETTSSSGGRLALVPLARLSDLERNLTPLSAATGVEIDLKDLFKGLRERVLSRNREVVAVPIAAPSLVCYYRRDLLKAAGKKTPVTWDDYQELIDSLEQWAPNLTAVEPLAPEFRSTTFFARSLAYTKHPENYSVWFDLETGNPVVDSPGFIEAINVAQKAWKKMPTTIREMTPADCRQSILSGKSAMALSYEPLKTERDLSGGDRAKGIEIGVCRLPGSLRVFNRNSNRWETLPPAKVHAPGMCGSLGWALGVTVPEEGSNQTAAWNLLATLVDREFDSAWATLPKSICRESQIADAPAWNESGITTEESSQFVDALAQMLRDSQIVSDLPVPAADEFRAAASRAVSKILDGEESSSEIAKSMQSEFDAIASSLGKEELRMAYRRGLGMATLSTLQRLNNQ